MPVVALTSRLNLPVRSLNVELTRLAAVGKTDAHVSQLTPGVNVGRATAVGSKTAMPGSGMFPPGS